MTAQSLYKCFNLKRVAIYPISILIVSIALLLSLSSVTAETFNVGPKKCQGCHKAEFTVWKGTPHATSFKKIHKSKKAKAIVKAVGGKRMKKTELCASCHYTVAAKKVGGKPKLVAGPSCESCHGPAANWIKIHNTKAPREKRVKEASAKGMIWPQQLFRVATNCNSCHGFGSPKVSGENIKAMLDAGHPLNADFELVQYSQGIVRHRFYPPKVTENQVMTPPELARMFVVGQAANLVSATANAAKSNHPEFVKAQKKRIEKAKSILNLVSGQVPEAAKVLASPTKENGIALTAAIAKKDLSGAVSGKLPKNYK